MLQPKRTKFRKQQKGRNRGKANVGNKVSFGDFGLKATTLEKLGALGREEGIACEAVALIRSRPGRR